MSEWLDLMLAEIERKNREKRAALEELERRRQSDDDDQDGAEPSGDGK